MRGRSPAEEILATSFSTRRVLRKIPAFRSLSPRGMDHIQGLLIERSYKAGEVLWRTRGTVGFLGFIQSGDVEVEYQIAGILVRSTRLSAGDPILPRRLKSRSRHATILVRAITDVRLSLVAEAQIAQVQAAMAGKSASGVRLKRTWPLLLLLLIFGLARSDIVRIASGLLYMASNNEHYYHSHDPLLSMGLLKYAEQMDPGAAFAYNEEGYRWFQQRRLSDAEFAFVQAVGSDPAHVPAMNNMAITYFSRGDIHSAARYLQQAVELDPNLATVRYNLGIILMLQNEHAGAIREFREASFIAPEAASPHLQQAFLYIQTGDNLIAEQHARSAIQLNPFQSSTHLLLAIALYNQGRYTEALDSIAATLQLEPEDRVASFYDALILERLGQHEAALTVLERLLATSADSRESDRISIEIEAIHRHLLE